jgi:hypothetical protein
MRTLGDLHDGSTDLRTPGALVRSIQRSHQIVLLEGVTGMRFPQERPREVGTTAWPIGRSGSIGKWVQSIW